MTVNPGVLLAVNDDRDVPGPQVFNDLTVLLLGGVKFGELIALVVRTNLKSGGPVLATDKVDTADEAVVVGTINGLSTEEVLAGGLKTSLGTTCKSN